MIANPPTDGPPVDTKGSAMKNELALPLTLEDLFDKNKLESFRHNQDFSNSPETSSKYLQILNLINTQSHLEALHECEDLFHRSPEPIDKIFSLHWAVVISEILYDMNLRNKWLNHWNFISNWSQYSWAQFIFVFQKGLSHFYQGHLDLAEKQFYESLSIAIESSYERGMIRSYHHLGLIERDRKNTDQAIHFLRLALLKACEGNRINIIHRIEKELRTLNINENFDLQTKKILHYLQSNKLKEARNLIRNVKTLRKLEFRSPDSQSEITLWAMLLYATKKTKSLAIVMQYLKDPVVRHRTIELLNLIAPITTDLAYEYMQLNHQLDIKIDNKSNLLPHKMGISNYSKLPNEVHNLITLLSKHPAGLNKEQISVALWNQTYDPLYHDPKIYKLVMQCRKVGGLNGRLLNKYGTYVLASTTHS